MRLTWMYLSNSRRTHLVPVDSRVALCGQREGKYPWIEYRAFKIWPSICHKCEEMEREAEVTEGS